MNQPVNGTTQGWNKGSSLLTRRCHYSCISTRWFKWPIFSLFFPRGNNWKCNINMQFGKKNNKKNPSPLSCVEIYKMWSDSSLNWGEGAKWRVVCVTSHFLMVFRTAAGDVIPSDKLLKMKDERPEWIFTPRETLPVLHSKQPLWSLDFKERIGSLALFQPRGSIDLKQPIGLVCISDNRKPWRSLLVERPKRRLTTRQHW